MHYKVWFKPHGEEPDEVSEKIKALQLATADARLAELERRNATLTNRAQKEKQRKVRQKAARKAAKEQQQPGADRRPAGERQSEAKRHVEQQPKAANRDEPMAMAADVRVAAESAAYVIAAVSNHPSTARVQRVAKLRDKGFQVTVLQGTVAARMNELQLGEVLASAHNEQQRKDLLHKIMQQAGPQSSGLPSGMAKPTFRMPAQAGSSENGFELFS